MPIKNTNRLSLVPEIGKVKLGTPKSASAPGRNQPHFRVESEYLPPEHLLAVLGAEPTELVIHFPKFFEDEQRSFEFIYKSAYKAYQNNRWFCTGDGETATRNSKDGPTERSCPCELLTGDRPSCKQQGELRFAIQGLPSMGYFQMLTHSWKGIANLDAAIPFFYNYLGENFWKVRFILFKSIEVTPKGKQYVVNLRLHPDSAGLHPSIGDRHFPLDTEEDSEHDAVEAEPAVAMAEVQAIPVEVPDERQEPEIQGMTSLDDEDMYAVKVLDYCNKSSAEQANKGLDKVLLQENPAWKLSALKLLATEAKFIRVKDRAKTALAELLPSPAGNLVKPVLDRNDRVRLTKLKALLKNWSDITNVDANAVIEEEFGKPVDYLDAAEISQAFAQYSVELKGN